MTVADPGFYERPNCMGNVTALWVAREQNLKCPRAATLSLSVCVCVCVCVCACVCEVSYRTADGLSCIAEGWFINSYL